MRSYFAYIRVSTIKQGEHGVSLSEQRDAIVQFAHRNNLNIIQWFEERETAAKIGRREFNHMLAALRKQRASGVIFHKIDRSARNLKDWSVIQDLAEQGIDVRFSQEAVNLRSNEGKLTGDFLAVIASHYIRNLREEVKKGIVGRLKQGIYPLGAPTGYLDQGGGKVKIPDPIRAPLIREAFDLYASGTYGIRNLCDELWRRGLRNRNGNRVYPSTIATILRNPFYIGIIRMRSGDTYSGLHEPLISNDLFALVQDRLDGKKNAKLIKHNFLYRRLIRCGGCGLHLIGERQKQKYIYYRCHTKGCLTFTVREERVEERLRSHLTSFTFEKEDLIYLRTLIASHYDHSAERQQERIHAVDLQVQRLDARLSRLTDAYLDGDFDKQLFADKKLSILKDRRRFEEERASIEAGQPLSKEKLEGILELLERVPLSHEMANMRERRRFIENVTSNFEVRGKDVAITLRSPFDELAKSLPVFSSALDHDRPRTLMKTVCHLLVEHCNSGAAKGEHVNQLLP
jgi:site-specific DNA recombinase